MTKGSATYYYIYDGLGNVVAVTDGAGQAVQTYDYDAFGNVISTTGELANPYQFVGGYGCADDGVGLVYMRARYYAPSIGRFISRDPWEGVEEEPQTLNRYVYVENNPIKWIDPNGYGWREFRWCMYKCLGPAKRDLGNCMRSTWEDLKMCTAEAYTFCMAVPPQCQLPCLTPLVSKCLKDAAKDTGKCLLAYELEFAKCHWKCRKEILKD